MKTFLLNISSQIKNWSDSLDAKTVLCSSSWLVFNDEGIKEVYIFNRDGTLLASHNGKVTRAHWEYLATNTAILIEQNNDTFMLKPFFYDNKVLALQQDGTLNFALMIGEKYVEELAIDNLAKASLYIAEQQENKMREEANTKKQELEKSKKCEWEEFIKMKIAEEMNSPEIVSKVKKHKILIFITAFICLLSFLLACKSIGIAQGIGCLICATAVMVILFLFIESDSLKEHIREKMTKQFPFEKFKE